MTKETAGVFTEKLLWTLILALFTATILPLGFMAVVVFFIFGSFSTSTRHSIKSFNAMYLPAVFFMRKPV